MYEKTPVGILSDPNANLDLRMIRPRIPRCKLIEAVHTKLKMCKECFSCLSNANGEIPLNKI